MVFRVALLLEHHAVGGYENLRETVFLNGGLTYLFQYAGVFFLVGRVLVLLSRLSFLGLFFRSGGGLLGGFFIFQFLRI